MTSKWYIMIVIIVASDDRASTGSGRPRPGERYFDIFKLKAPVFGPLNHKIAIARFARTFVDAAVLGRPDPAGDGDGGRYR